MSAFRQFAGGGLDFMAGVIGGYTNTPTGSPSLSGGTGELFGKKARAMVDQYQKGQQFQTMQQIAMTQHFKDTGQKVDLYLPPKS